MSSVLFAPRSDTVSEEVSSHMKELEETEPILSLGAIRTSLYPIKYGEAWEMYKQHEASYWTAEELDLAQDLKDWEQLKEDERHFIKMVLAFFSASDGIVMENLSAGFLADVKVPEFRCYYAFQNLMENIHSETYSLLIDEYVKDGVEKDRLFRAIETVHAVELKARWAAKWMNKNNSFAERVVAFTAVEGILFSGSFCAIFWLKKRGLMPGLTFSNELISRDEGIHTDFGCLLYGYLENKLPEECVQQIIREAVEAERVFICESLPCALIGMNSKQMTAYIEHVADRLLNCLGCDKIFGSANPFDWMELISVPGKTNFFEKRVGEYQKSGVMATKKDQVFKTNVDF
ncbi:MAG: uncharacterized protein KVP18_004482 [Porospora cf. gigantea A]|uniref:uncharacterized protein n=1 Tax=Porospora cf. gigantea A TaxID=2853593 RepID=UPI00355A27ED|nr:MAG: hypothetical protein KVP18_004482 [Porospora cf. gigantea A]